jgi:hypothetical protein
LKLRTVVLSDAGKFIVFLFTFEATWWYSDLM